MTADSWVLAHREKRQDLEPRVAELLQEFVDCDDEERAQRLSSRLELAVAPPRGGLGKGPDHVVSVLVAHLPLMSAAARPEAVSLICQIGYSMSVVGGRWAEEGRRLQSGALPAVAALAQVGDVALRTEFVDFAALCAAVDPDVVDEVSFYLQCLADQGGVVGTAAAQEAAQLSSHPGTSAEGISDLPNTEGPVASTSEDR